MADDGPVRDERMADFRRKVERLVEGLNTIDDISCLMPGGTFYAFPSVKRICNRYGITSHGLALFLLEAADGARGVACLGGECFGEAGGGFLRLSCAEPDERLTQAVAFIAEAVTRSRTGGVVPGIAHGASVGGTVRGRLVDDHRQRNPTRSGVILRFRTTPVRSSPDRPSTPTV